MSGTIIEIHIAPASAAPTQSVPEAHVVPGRGIEGDRYYHGSGTFSKEAHKPDAEVTLVEVEKVEEFNREFATTFHPGDFRRNIVTRGIDLNALEGKEFTIGGVRFLGHGLCEPCTTLQKITDERILPGLVHKAGLRAQILEYGVVRVGDSIRGK